MWPLFMLLLTEAADTDTVEHRVSETEAAAVIRHLNLSQLEGGGCRPCSERQRGYCLSPDLFMDHCTCDHRHNERLPYAAHTCYVPVRVPPTFATDCLEYTRLLECCCHSLLFPLWKKKLLGGSSSSQSVVLPWPSLYLVVVVAILWTLLKFPEQ